MTKISHLLNNVNNRKSEAKEIKFESVIESINTHIEEEKELTKDLPEEEPVIIKEEVQETEIIEECIEEITEEELDSSEESIEDEVIETLTEDDDLKEMVYKFKENIFSEVQKYQEKLQSTKDKVVNISFGLPGLLILLAVVFLAGSWTGHVSTRLKAYEVQEELRKEIELQEEKHKEVTGRQLKYIDILEDKVHARNNSIDELETELTNTIEERDSMTDELNKFRKRNELYNKYEIMVTNTNGKRTEITYEDIEWMEGVATEKKFLWV